MGTTVIIGDIDVEVEASDDDSGIYRVNFYVDGSLEETVGSSPYRWSWDESGFGRYSVKVVAFDNAGNSAEDSIDVWKFF